MTRIVPNASESGTLRRGLTTSPAVKVILFHASAEKSELVCATQMPTKRPNAVAAVRPCPTSCNPPRKLQKSEKFAAPAPDRKKLDRVSRLRSEEHTSELQSQSNLVCR